MTSLSISHGLGGRTATAVLTAVTATCCSAVLAAGNARADQQPDGERSPSPRTTTEPLGPVRVGLTFERPVLAPGSVVGRVVNMGVAPVSIAAVRTDGGVLRSVDHQGQALRTPGYQDAGDEPRAVLRIRSAESGTDVLDPGESSFAFGASFRLDALSDGTPVDNGDNLVQRGLATDVSQFKLELDGRRPACRVQGSVGTVRVVSPVVVRARSWYRALCHRYAGRVVLTVTDLASGTDTRTTARGGTGSLRPVTSGVPLSVAGKLHADGSLVTDATDQFNGVVDDVVLRIR